MIEDKSWVPILNQSPKQQLDAKLKYHCCLFTPYVPKRKMRRQLESERKSVDEKDGSVMKKWEPKSSRQSEIDPTSREV